ncbi:hypothetical protein L6164_018665 [Bauhinia variegata]|uniref:Uncharacterized protein n=1 Tax=Bauhinia variegata TaxID=167791 RepID=A0ACB9NC48_BAUVA|nr:hypothetical protein L6164_018665 [Bauhinia variegata]
MNEMYRKNKNLQVLMKGFPCSLRETRWRRGKENHVMSQDKIAPSRLEVLPAIFLREISVCFQFQNVYHPPRNTLFLSQSSFIYACMSEKEDALPLKITAR